VPPTVRSRCQQVHIAVRDRSAAERWLKAQGVDDAPLLLALCGGAPLEALAAATTPVWERRPELLRGLTEPNTDGIALAERFRELPPAALLSWLQKWTFDLLCMRFSGHVRYHLDLIDLARALAATAEPHDLARLHRRLLGQQRSIHHPLNPRLLIEQMLMDCRHVLLGAKGAMA